MATIDERVVQMRFDNSQFEKGAHQTINTLDELSKHSNFDGLVSGLSKAAISVGGFTLAPLRESIDGVKKEFSVLNKVSTAVITNITNKVVDAGQRMAKSLTVAPISQGFQEYELKMGSVQTIMASTGASIEEVNRYLNELNAYADKTIYSFSDMTNNIGKFTNAGVSLDAAVKAIQGISNEAALAGANAQQASHAMYNFAQAMSSGSVRLMDWRSIENAQMSTKEFRQELIDTAEALGTVVKEGDRYRSTTTDLTGHVSDAFDAVKGFNDSLSSQWMTTDVLVQTLGRYSDATTTLGQRAFSAAQDVKTFSQLMDTLKEAVGSGWAQSFEIIFGNFEDAKSLWSKVADVVGDLIQQASDARNEFLEGGLASGWDQLVNKIGGDAADIQAALMEAGRNSGVAVDQLVEKTGSFESSLEEGWVTTDILQGGLDILHSRLETLSKSTNVTKAWTASAILQFEKFYEEVTNSTISVDGLTESLGRVPGRINVIQGISALFQTLGQVAKMAGYAVGSVFSRPTIEGFYKATQTFKEVLSSFQLSEEAAYSLYVIIKWLLLPIKALGVALQVVASIAVTFIQVVWDLVEGLLTMWATAGSFSGLLNKIFGDERYARLMTALNTIVQNVSDRLHSLIDAVKEFVQISAPMDKLKAGFQALVPIFQTIGDAILDGIVVAFEWIAKTDIFDAFKSIGDGLRAIVDSILEAFGVMGTKTRDAVGTVIDSIKEKFAKGKDDIENTEFGKTVGGALGEASKLLSDAAGMFSGVNIVAGITTTINNIKSMLTPIVGFFKGLIDGIMAVISRLDFSKFISGFEALKNGLVGIINAFVTGGFKAGIDAIVAAVQNVASGLLPLLVSGSQKLKEFFGNLDAGKLLVGGFGVAIIGFVLMLTKMMKSISGIASSLTSSVVKVSNSVSGVMDAIAARTAPAKTNPIIQGITAVTKAILAIAAALTIMSFIPADKLTRVSVAMGALIGVMALFVAGMVGLSVVMSKFVGATEAMAVLATALTTFSTAILILSASLLMLNKVDIEGLGYRVLALVGVMAALTAALTALSVLAPAMSTNALTLIAFSLGVSKLMKTIADMSNVDLSGVTKQLPALLTITTFMVLISVAASKVKFGTAMGMTILIKDIVLFAKEAVKLSEYDFKVILEGVVNMLPIIAAMALVMKATTLAGKNALGVGIGMMGIAASLLMCCQAIKSLAAIDEQTLKQGGAVVLAILGVFSIVIVSTKAAGKYAAQAGVAIMAMSASILLLQFAVKYLGEMDMGAVIQGTAVVSALMIVFSLVLSVSRQATASVGTIVAIGACIGMLSVAVMLLALLPIADLLASATSLSAVMIALAAVFKIIDGMDWKSMLGNAGAMAVMIGSITAALILLNTCDLGAILISATSLSAVMLAFAATTKLLKTMDWKDALIQAGLMAAFLLEISVAFYALNGLDMGAMLVTATSLSAVMLAFAGVSNLLKSITWQDALTAAGLLGAMLLEIGTAFYLLQDMDPVGMLGLATSLGITMLAMAGVVTIISFMKTDAKKALVTIGAIGLILAEMVAAFAVLQYVDMSDASPKINTMTKALIALTATVGAITFIGKMGIQSTLVGIGGFTAVLVAIGALGAAFGALQQVEGFNELMTQGAETFRQLGNVLGSFVGGLVGGIAAGTLDTIGPSLVTFGENLGTFGEEIGPFATAMKSMDQTVVDAVGSLADMILKLTAADVVDGIAKFFGGGESSLTDFASELESFAPSFVAFANTLQGANINVDLVNSAAACASTMAELAGNLPSTGGVLQEWFGEKDLGTFGTRLQEFGTGLVGYYNSLQNGGNTIDFDLITASSSAATTLADLAKHLPSTGGVLQEWFGEKDLGLFGTRLAQFGDAIVQYSNAITAGDGLDTEAITASANAASMLVELNNNLPTEGGSVKTWFMGETLHLDTFGERLVDFGEAVVAYYNAMRDANITTADVIKTGLAAQMVTTLANDLPETGGLKGFIFGDKDLTDFSDALSTFGDALADFYASLSDIDTLSIDPVAKLKQVGGDLVGAICDGIDEAKQDLIDLGDDVVGWFAEGLRKAGPGIKPDMSAFADDIVSYMKGGFGIGEGGYSSKLVSVGAAVAAGLAKGIRDHTNEVKTAADELSKAATVTTEKSFETGSPSKVFYGIGKNVVEGLSNGITENTSIANKSSTDMGHNIINAFKTVLDINSPSVVMEEEVGKMIVQGIAEGIEEDMTAEEVAKKKAEVIVDAFKEAVRNTNFSMDTRDLESQMWENLYKSESADEKEQEEIDAEIYKHKSEKLEADMRDQADLIIKSQGKYKAMVQQMGENSEEAQEAYKEWLQAQVDMSQMAKDLADLNKERNDALAGVDKDSSQTKDETTMFEKSRTYWETVRDNAEVIEKLKEQGFSEKDILKQFGLQTGFDPFWTEAKEVEKEMLETDPQKIFDQFFDATEWDVELQITEQMAESVAKGVSGGVNSAGAQAAAKAGGVGVAQGVGSGINSSAGTGAISDGLSGALEKALGGAGSGFDPSKFQGSGAGIADGLANGLSSGLKNLGSKVQEGGKKVLGWLQGALGEHSPSIYTQEMGEYLMEGLVLGMESGLNKIKQNMDEGVVPEFVNMIAQIFTSGVQLAKDSGLIQSSMDESIQVMLDTMYAKEYMFLDAGRTLGQTFTDAIATAIKDGQSAVISAACAVAEAAIASAKSKLNASTQSSGDGGGGGGRGGIGTGGGIKGLDEYLGSLGKTGSGSTTGGLAGSASSKEPSWQHGGAAAAAKGTPPPGYGVIFNQTNYSPKALSSIEIYRRTNNALSLMKGAGR